MYRNYTNDKSWINRSWVKIYVMTKLSFILLLSSILCTNAASLAQNVSLTRKNISFKEAFKEIKEQTGYNFLWAAENINRTETIALHPVDVPLQNTVNKNRTPPCREKVCHNE